MLAGMNSLITGGYLTTRGRSIEDDRRFLCNLQGFTCGGKGGHNTKQGDN
jgi:biotin synthase